MLGGKRRRRLSLASAIQCLKESVYQKKGNYCAKMYTIYKEKVKGEGKIIFVIYYKEEKLCSRELTVKKKGAENGQRGKEIYGGRK